MACPESKEAVKALLDQLVVIKVRSSTEQGEEFLCKEMPIKFPPPLPQQKDIIRDGGSTALYTVYTVFNVYTVLQFKLLYTTA